MNVLHIEDQPDNRLLVRKVLESRGHTVSDAPDGLVGVQIAGGTRPDIILVDINIPGLTGYEVVTRLRSESHLSQVPIVAITAEGDREYALALGFDGFISKPIRMGSFVQELQAFVDGRRESVSDECRAEHLMDHSRQVVDRLETRLRELERANARLKEVEKLKMAVLRNVSHELSTPLTPVLGYIRMMANGELGPVNEMQVDVLNRMGTATQRLKALIDNLLNATRFAKGINAIERSLARPGDIIDEAVAGVERLLGEREIDLVVDCSESVRNYAVVLDRTRVAEAIGHVLHNAVRFGPVGGRVSLTLKLDSSHDGGEQLLVVEVSDQGPGIAFEERERVVEPFYQCDGSVTRSHGGAGLGLAIAQSTATAHGGRLQILDGAQGACIVLRVPITPTG